MWRSTSIYVCVCPWEGCGRLTCPNGFKLCKNKWTPSFSFSSSLTLSDNFFFFTSSSYADGLVTNLHSHHPSYTHSDTNSQILVVFAGMVPAIAPGSVMAWESTPEMWVNEAGWPQCSQGLWQEADYHAELVTLSLRPPQDDGDAVQSAVLYRQKKVKWETCIRFALNTSPQNILENTRWVFSFSFISQPFPTLLKLIRLLKGKIKCFQPAWASESKCFVAKQMLCGSKTLRFTISMSNISYSVNRQNKGHTDYAMTLHFGVSFPFCLKRRRVQ